MDRLGGFRLCRRLLDTEGTLSPFLSSDAMVGKGQGNWKGNGGGTGVSSRGSRMRGGTGTVQGVRACHGGQPRLRTTHGQLVQN